MWLVAGLGNPGREYAGTRHNLGFAVVERLGRRWRIALDRDGFEGRYGKGATPAGTPVVLLTPMTFMNDSGRSVAAAAQFFKIAPERLIVALDDLALPPGTIRVRKDGSAGGHRGLADIIRLLGREDFGRVRIGIGLVPAGWTGRDYVLSRAPADQAELLEAAADRSADAIELWIEQGGEAAMNRFNRPAVNGSREA